MGKLGLVVGVCALALFAPLAEAQAGAPSVVVGSGWSGFDRAEGGAVEGRLELRFGSASRGPRALAAAFATSDGAVFVGAGIGYRIALGRLDLLPSFVPGVYRAGPGHDLGHPLEFRSQLEIGFRVSAVSRLALSLSHLSNGGLGAYNPGQETVALACEVSFGRGDH